MPTIKNLVAIINLVHEDEFSLRFLLFLVKIEERSAVIDDRIGMRSLRCPVCLVGPKEWRGRS